MKNKIMKTLLASALACGLFMNSISAFAAEDINYKTYFNTKTATTYNDETGLIHVTGDEEKELFTSSPVYETVYTTAYLNLREEPTIETSKFTTLIPNSELTRVGKSECGWDIIQINGVNYFMWNEYLSEAPLDMEITEIYEVKTDQPGIYTGSSNSNSTSNIDYSSNENVSENSIPMSSNAAKEEIARRESGGDYNAVSPTGKYIGRYQLNNSMLNGDYSPENQERVAEAYVAERYGSWDAALAFWDAHGWY